MKYAIDTYGKYLALAIRASIVFRDWDIGFAWNLLSCY
jgi:hypothetical protein